MVCSLYLWFVVCLFFFACYVLVLFITVQIANLVATFTLLANKTSCLLCRWNLIVLMYHLEVITGDEKSCWKLKTKDLNRAACQRSHNTGTPWIKTMGRKVCCVSPLFRWFLLGLSIFPPSAKQAQSFQFNLWVSRAVTEAIIINQRSCFRVLMKFGNLLTKCWI